MRSFISFLSSALIIAFVLCCGQGNDDEGHTTWCILLDMSGVRKEMETKEQYSESFKKIVEHIDEGDALVVTMITESSVNEPDFVISHTFQVYEPTTDNILLEKEHRHRFDSLFQSDKSQLGEVVEQFIIANPRITESTDILGAIHVAANVFRKYANASQRLILFSDMEQYSSDYKFPSENLNPDRIRQIIEVESQKARGVPDLSGVKVYVVGAKSADNDRFFRIKNFWMAYFDACNASMMKEDYGAALIKI